MLTLHVQGGVHNVLQNLGACHLTRFGNMAHNENGNPLILGHSHQGSRAFPDLQEVQAEVLGW